MSVLKIPMMLLKIPLLVILGLLQAVLNILDRLSGLLSGLLTLILAGFWIHHLMQGNRENVILLSISLAMCIGIPVLLQGMGLFIRWISDTIL